jgi:hypothetical protein
MRRVPYASQSTHTLSPFVSPAGDTVHAIEARVDRLDNGELRFQYALQADVSLLRIPGLRPEGPADELWKHTCFEAFVARAPGDGSSMPANATGAAIGEYLELNFSPSTEWAVYSFDRYREGMAPVAMPSPPQMRIGVTPGLLTLDVRVDTRVLFDGAKLLIALAAVIEDDSGNISYWALKHAPTKPDFHHPAGFILEV